MEPCLNSPAYPRSYRMSAGWTVFMLLFGVAAVAGGAYGAWYFFQPGSARDPLSGLVLAGVCALFLVFGLYVILWVLKGRVVLYPDRIEVYEALTRRTLSRDQILGRRSQQGRKSPGTIILVPREGLRNIKLALVYKMDEPFRRWIFSLPDLDAQDLKASREELLGPPGPARAERKRALAQARRVAGIFMFAGFAAFVWGFTYPRPYSLVIAVLALMPWLAIFITARSHGMFRLNDEKNVAHPNVAMVFIMPGFALAIRAMDFHLLEWKPALALSVAAGAALWMAAAAADPRLRRKPAIPLITFLFCMAYGYGLSTEANALLDRSSATVYRTVVLRKRVSTGRSTHYRLTLAAWGQQQTSSELSVPRSFYYSVLTGGPVCVMARPGALHVPWYVVSECQQP